MRRVGEAGKCGVAINFHQYPIFITQGRRVEIEKIGYKSIVLNSVGPKSSAMPSALSKPVDTSNFPAYFSLLPVRIHHETKAIDKAALDAIDICAPEGSKVRKSALRRLSNPFGGPYVLCFPESDTEKLKLFAQFFELFWTHDGRRPFFLNCSASEGAVSSLPNGRLH